VRHGNTTLRRFAASSCCQIHTSSAIHTAVPGSISGFFRRNSGARGVTAQQHLVQVQEHTALQAMTAARQACQAFPACAAELAVQTIRVNGVEPVECEHDGLRARASREGLRSGPSRSVMPLTDSSSLTAAPCRQLADAMPRTPCRVLPPALALQTFA